MPIDEKEILAITQRRKISAPYLPVMEKAVPALSTKAVQEPKQEFSIAEFPAQIAERTLPEFSGKKYVVDFARAAGSLNPFAIPEMVRHPVETAKGLGGSILDLTRTMASAAKHEPPPLDVREKFEEQPFTETLNLATPIAIAAGAARLAKPKPRVFKSLPELEQIKSEFPEMPVEAEKKTLPVLTETEQILNRPKKAITAADVGRAIKKAPAKAQELFTQEFKPVSQVEAQIYREAGIESPKVSLGAKLEQVAGAPGKAHADYYDFVKNVTRPVPRNLKGDFASYLTLKRIEDRLATNPETRAVGNFTLEKARQGLAELKTKIGDEQFTQLEKQGQAFQIEADKALRLQVESGRMSEERYQDIKKMNQFYARFKALKYMDAEGKKIEGTGRGLATKKDLTKAIQGMSEETLQKGLENPIAAQAEQIYRSRILAEKNMAMREVAKLADIENAQVKRIKPDADVPEGFEKVAYLENGQPAALQVPKEMAEALKGLNQVDVGMLGKTLQAAKRPMQAGATTLSAGFQVVNYPLDQLRLAIMSKYGLRASPLELARYPLDIAQGILGGISLAIDRPTRLAQEWLRSGAAGSVAQEWINPEAFRPKFGVSAVKKALTLPIDVISKGGGALERSTKITAYKRGVRIENFAELSPEAQRAKLPEIIQEVRRYGGSPDFSRFGRWGRPLNLLFPFLNPAIQGTAADVGRLIGATGGRNMAASLVKATTVIGLPTLYLTLNNLSDEYREDYEKLSDQDKNNYFWIPTPDSAKDYNGDPQRVWITIPKKHVVQLYANLIESAIRFADKNDPEELKDFAANTLKNLSPINVSGETLGEVGESVIGATNPVLSVPYKLGANRETYFHQPIVPERIAGVESQNLPPEEQYRSNTPKAYVELGRPTNLSPLKIEAAVKGFTGSAVSQFAPPKLREGEPGLRAIPGLSRFAKRPGKIEEPLEKPVKAALQEQAVADVRVNRAAETLFESLQGKSQEQILNTLTETARANPAIVEEVLNLAEDKQLGLTYSDRLIRQLQVENGERARFLKQQILRLSTPEEQANFIAEMSNKKILTRKVFEQMLEPNR